MDQRLPSGQPPDAAPPSAPSGVAKVKETPETSSHLETKQEYKLRDSQLVSHLQNDVVSLDSSENRNGDVDVSSDELKKQKSYPRVDSQKETVTPLSKSELDSNQSSSPTKRKITSIQFAELPLDPSISNTRSLRDPEMKSDLQRSSTVPEISLRKEPSEEPVTVSAIANVDMATVAAGGNSSLMDWNAENRILYRNNVEMRSAGNLAFHSTIEEEPGCRADKKVDKDDVTLVTIRDDSSSKSEERTAKTVVTTSTVFIHENGCANQETTSQSLPSKCGVSHNHNASPSHVNISFPKDVSKTEISVKTKELVSDSNVKSSLPDGPSVNLDQVPRISDQTASKSKDEGLSEKSFTVKEEKTISDAAQSLQKTQQSDVKVETSVEKSKADKAVSLEKQSGELSKPLAAVDQTKTWTQIKEQEKKDLTPSKKESSLSLAEELKLETKDVQPKKDEKLSSTETKDIKSQPQLTAEKMKTVEPPLSEKPAAIQTIMPEQVAVGYNEKKDAIAPSVKSEKENGSLTDSLLQKGEPLIKGAELKQSKDSFNLEQKNSQSDLSDDSLKKAYTSSKEGEIIASDSVKDVKEATLPQEKKQDEKSPAFNSFGESKAAKHDAPKTVPSPAEETSLAKSATSQKSIDKETTVPPKFEQKSFESDKTRKQSMEQSSQIITPEPDTKQSKEFVSKEAQKAQDAIQDKSKPTDLKLNNEIVMAKPDICDKKTFQQPDTLKKAENSDLVIKKKDLDQSSISGLSDIVNKETSIQSKEQSLKSDIQDVIKQEALPKPTVPPQEKETIQAKPISPVKKKETLTSAKVTVPEIKHVPASLAPQEKASFHPETVAPKNEVIAPIPTSSTVDKVKETKVPEISSKVSLVKDISMPEGKKDVQLQPASEKIVPLPSLSSAEIKKSKQELTALEEPAITDNTEKHLGKSPKKDSSLAQVISSEKEVSDAQRVVEKKQIAERKEDTEKKETDISEKKLVNGENEKTDIEHPSKEKEKPISSLTDISGSVEEIKIEKPKDTEKQVSSKDKKELPELGLSKKDEISNLQHTKIETKESNVLPKETVLSTISSTHEEKSFGAAPVSIETKKVYTETVISGEKMQAEVKPDSKKKDEAFVPSEVKVPEKKPSKVEESISLQTHIPPLQVEAERMVKEDKTLTLQKEKDIYQPKSIYAPSKEAETLGAQKDKKEDEILKLQSDALKENTVIQVSVNASKEKEVPLYSLDISDERKEVPTRDEEMKQTEKKEFLTEKERSVLQHKRIDSVVPKDNIEEKTITDSIEVELKKLPTIDQVKGALEEKQILPSQQLIDATPKKDEDALRETTKPTSYVPGKEEISISSVPKETVLPETAKSNILSEPSMKVEPTVTSLASRDNIDQPCINDDKINLPHVPCVTQEESKSDGAKEIKATEERPIKVPQEIVQEEVHLDKEAVSIEKSSTDKADIEKEISQLEDSTAEEDTSGKQNAINNKKPLPVTANGLVPHLSGGEIVDKPESKKTEQEIKDQVQKTEEKIKESQEEKPDTTKTTSEILESEISDEQKPVETSEEIIAPDTEISTSKHDKITDQDSQETTKEAEESIENKEGEQEESVDESNKEIKTETDEVIETSDNLKKEVILSPKKKKLIMKSEEIKGTRSASPHKENGQRRRKLHKRSESRDKPEVGTLTEKQTNRQVDNEENEVEKAAQDKEQKSPTKRKLRRAHRSAEERETTSVSDSTKVPSSPVKKPSTAPTQKGLTSPRKTPYSRNGLLSPTKSLKGDKKLPPIKAAVGFAPNPNLKNIKSKIGSFDNIHYKPKGGDKKVITAKKLEWNATPKVKSLENSSYKPGGGDKKIITQKLDFKEKAQAKSVDSESDTDAIEIAKGERKKDHSEDEATTTEAQESKEPDSVDAAGETSEDQEVAA